MDPTKHGLAIEASVTDVVVELYLNGIPVGLCGVGMSRKIAIPVNEYMLDGKNELAMLINPGDSPAKALDASTEDRGAWGAQPPSTPLEDAFRSVDQPPPPPADAPPPPPPIKLEDVRSAADWGDHHANRDVEGLVALPSHRATARLMKYPVGAMSGDGSGVPILSVDWNARDTFRAIREEKQPYPRWARAAADLGPMFGPAHWTTADKLTLDDATRAEVLALVEKIQDHIEKGRPDPVLELQTMRHQEVSLAYGIPVGERAGVFRRVITEYSKKDTWIFETPLEEEISIRLVADGRLVECVMVDWKPMIRGVPTPEGRFLYPMFLGRQGGRWLIMR